VALSRVLQNLIYTKYSTSLCTELINCSIESVCVCVCVCACVCVLYVCVCVVRVFVCVCVFIHSDGIY